MNEPLGVVNLKEKLEQFSEAWKPKIVGAVGDYLVKLVKLRGPFVWHHHEVEDELFLVIEGTLTMRLRDRDLTVRPGEFVIIPHGTEHCPVAESEVHVLLFEPASTLNTGNLVNERTVKDLDRL